MSNSDKCGLDIHYPLVVVNSGPKESGNDGTVLTSDLREAMAKLCEKGSSGSAIADIIG
jgi:hypothetical protein